ncbi:MAG: NAD-dependent malic enzyme [Gammaproteobacteria bacterium CG11_big_fil_rev_8_21_14_0_20_46_22]|nr:MAG: NAD-dependent malic enzyme [Gammaproteobacteria bacterium CG12_big_fil_rev_8_21_14_0_65_46_12]PIR10800.1 MAG: NAD-dependent malic enzyme [Gammaproteobacteria bacterium CG11_big_fil_rev_8_21_14_0_20_46_22]
MSRQTISAANSITLRMSWDDNQCNLSEVSHVVEALGAQIVGIDVSGVQDGRLLRDITIFTSNPKQSQDVQEALAAMPAVEVFHVSDRTFLMHLGGKLEMRSKVALKTRDDLSMAYTPGVARVCMAIHEDPSKVFNLTIKRNMVAVITDGTAVLGLGDIGPEASLPVMEGKAVLFKQFAGVDAFPIALNTKDTDEIVDTVLRIAPVFGGINLEDISAPRCFEVERRLQDALDIPVFHDDQHGTAVVLAAAMINALKLVNKRFEDLKVVVLGVGAAGVACSNILLDLGVKNVIGCDRQGALYDGREGMNEVKVDYAKRTNPNKEQGDIHKVIKGADVFIGLSGPDMMTVDDVKSMNQDAIVFAMSNPTPEIMPEEIQGIAKIIATGRSDYPNQINNVLCFPGLFRGALDCMAKEVNEAMKLAAAYAIAGVIDDKNLHPDYIIPSVFDKAVVSAVSEAVIKAAHETGVARKG